MKIEVGRFYRTRSGLKARIYATDGAGKGPVHGAILVEGQWGSTVFKTDGKFSYTEDDWDLVSEWQDPVPSKPRMLAYSDSDGHVRFIPDGEYDPKFRSRLPWIDQPEDEK